MKSEEGPTQSGSPPDKNILNNTFRLHVPDSAGEFRVRKLLGDAWGRSAYRKWSQLHFIPCQPDQMQTPKQYSLHSGPRKEDIERLVRAKIVGRQRGGKEGIPMRPFYLSDPAKGRYRLITDVPHLNKSIKGKVRAALPKITKMYRQLLSTSWIVSADFACFYFQLPLHKRKGSAYTFRH